MSLFFFKKLDFIVDVLLGCVSQEVRDKASIQLFRLSQAQGQSSKNSLTQVRMQKMYLQTKCIYIILLYTDFGQSAGTIVGTI